MKVERKELIVIGAGPAGLSAAIEAARYGVHVTVFDENDRPGGQLFKQIHKFFGSKEHKAKEELLAEAERSGVEVVLSATVIGLYKEKEVLVQIGGEVRHFKGDAILVATGAAENMVNFRGWTLPGVIGAGAAQTMMNLHHIKPGNRILMLGTGNVGLVVSFQLLQAGCEVVALADAAPAIGGYGVHAAKLARCGVPFYLSHTIKEVEGTDCVKGVTIAEVDSHFQFIPGTEKHFDVDTVCVAVGLSPMAQLLKMDGIKMASTKGGYVPVCDETGATSVPGIYAAGDVAGIEEASSAMIEGRMSGAAIAKELGYTDAPAEESRIHELAASLDTLRQGMFAPKNRGKKIEKTEEGIPISENLLHHGFVADDEISRFPGISVDESHCINCGMCVASCSGQAIFLVAEETEPGYGEVTIPYEFLPLPEVGDKGTGLGRDGRPLCPVEITRVRSSKAFDGTNLVTMKVPMRFIDQARFYKKA